MDVIKDFLVHLRAGGASPATIRTRRYYLYRTARTVDLLGAKPKDLEKFIGSHNWGNETARSARSTLTTFYAWLYDTGQIPSNPARNLPVIREKPPNPHPLPEDEYARLLRIVPGRWLPAVRLAGEAGLRRGEIAKVCRDDLFKDLLGWTITVHGKGGRERYVPLNNSLAALLLRHFKTEFWLYPSRSFSGHITEDYIAKRVSSYLPPRWSTHSLRHRFATVIYASSRDIRAVQVLLGHANLNTTQRYVAMPKDRLREVANMAAA